MQVSRTINKGGCVFKFKPIRFQNRPPYLSSTVAAKEKDFNNKRFKKLNALCVCIKYKPTYLPVVIIANLTAARLQLDDSI
jgi:hypothetical protein